MTKCNSCAICELGGIKHADMGARAGADGGRGNSVSQDLFRPHHPQYLLVGEQLYSATNPSETDCRITYWYGEEEKKARRSNIRFIKGYFPQVELHEIPKMDHAELVMIYPQEFCRNAEKFLDQES